MSAKSNAVGCAALLLLTLAPALIPAAAPPPDTNTATPIKHVIVIIGENRSFDHVFATYKPKDGQTV